MQRTSRRLFLKSSAAGIAAAACPTIVRASALGKGGAVAPSDRITLGYIGVGYKGTQDCREQMGVTGTQVLAVCDARGGRRQGAKRMADRVYGNTDCKAYADFRDLLARDDIDAVGIGTPDHWHVPMTIMAARAGKHVSCEKPLGISLEEDLCCREVIRRSGVVFQYGTEARSNPRLREACEVVRSGALGPIRQIHVYSPNSHPGGSRTPQPVPADLDYDLWLGPAPWRPYSGCAGGGGSWYHVRDYALGFIAGWAAHPLDLMVWAYDITAAGPWEIEGTGRIDTRGSNDAVYDWDVRITLGNGVRMTLRTDGSPGGPPHPHKNLSGNYALFIGERGSIALSYNRVWADPPDLMRTPRTVRLKQSVGQEDDFIRCIRTGGETPVSPIEDAVTSDLVSQLSDTAIRSGRKVRFDPLKRGVIEGGVQQYCARAMREPWRL